MSYAIRIDLQPGDLVEWRYFVYDSGEHETELALVIDIRWGGDDDHKWVFDVKVLTKSGQFVVAAPSQIIRKIQ
jgi:hypothetical protein